MRYAFATVVMLAIALAFWVLAAYWPDGGSDGIPIPPIELVTGVISGLVVLAIAGIWMSFFCETQMIKALLEAIDSRFNMLDALRRGNVKDVWYSDDDDGREDKRFRDRVEWEIRGARGEIRVLGIAATCYLSPTGFARRYVEQFITLPGAGGASLKMLLVHPMCEQAVSRALRESETRGYPTYDETTLWVEVLGSCDTVADWLKEGRSIEGRLYKVMPAWSLLFVNDVLFAEPYQFGTGGRASGKVPILEIAKGSRLYRQLDGHFRYVWECSSEYRIDQELVRNIRNRTSDDVAQFDAAIRCSRPDLFA